MRIHVSLLQLVMFKFRACNIEFNTLKMINRSVLFSGLLQSNARISMLVDNKSNSWTTSSVVVVVIIALHSQIFISAWQWHVLSIEWLALKNNFSLKYPVFSFAIRREGNKWKWQCAGCLSYTCFTASSPCCPCVVQANPLDRNDVGKSCNHRHHRLPFTISIHPLRCYDGAIGGNCQPTVGIKNLCRHILSCTSFFSASHPPVRLGKLIDEVKPLRNCTNTGFDDPRWWWTPISHPVLLILCIASFSSRVLSQ